MPTHKSTCECHDMNKVLSVMFPRSVVPGAHGYWPHWRWPWLESEHSRSMTGLRTI